MEKNKTIPTFPEFKAEQKRLRDWAIQHDQEKLKQAEKQAEGDKK